MGTSPVLDVDAILSRYGLSREDFCDRLGLGMPTIRSWMRGDRKPSVPVCQLAEERLGIPKHELRPDLWQPPPPRTRAKAMAV
jgi:transcriptional regulator with XRE-family HTH domain